MVEGNRWPEELVERVRLLCVEQFRGGILHNANPDVQEAMENALDRVRQPSGFDECEQAFDTLDDALRRGGNPHGLGGSARGGLGPPDVGESPLPERKFAFHCPGGRRCDRVEIPRRFGLGREPLCKVYDSRMRRVQHGGEDEDGG